MAVRMHVVAALSDHEELYQIFLHQLGPKFNSLTIESTPPWSFFTASVWGVAGSELIAGLKQLDNPGFLATTSDGSRWTLFLVRPGLEPLVFVHEFYLFRNLHDPLQTADPPEIEPIDPRLAFLEPDPEPGQQRVWSQFDSVAAEYADLGAPIADAFRDRVQGLTYGAAVNEFRQYEINRLLQSLTDAGFAYSHQELEDALTWQSTTERERDSDIGNLPRVLRALGLEGSIAAFFDSLDSDTHGEGDSEIDNPDELGNDAEEYEADDIAEYEADDTDEDCDDEEISEEDQQELDAIESQMAEALKQQRRSRVAGHRAKKNSPNNPWGDDTFLSATCQAADAHPLLTMAGGVLNLDISELALLDFLAQAISAAEFPPAVIRIVPPSDCSARDWDVRSPNCTDIEVRPVDDGWLIGLRSIDVIEPASWKGEECEDFLAAYLGQSLATALRRPPDGTYLQVDFADSQHPDVCIRFGGLVAKDQWQISSAFPQLDRATLAAALGWARRAEESAYELDSDEEALAILAAAHEDNYLHNMGVQREGRVIRCEHDGMGFLARLILRRRFAHVWNFGPALEHAAQIYRERKVMERQMRRQAAQMRRDRSPPVDRQQVIYRGLASNYWKSDMAAWSTLKPEPREQFDAAILDLGFVHVGDFVCKKIRDFVQRCYISPDGQSYAILLAASYGYVGQEFVSHFESGAHLTTSTSWLAQSHPEVDLFSQHCEFTNLASLYARHQWGIARFHSHKQTVPIELSPTLTGLCQLFDQILKRSETVQSNLISVETISLDGDM